MKREQEFKFVVSGSTSQFTQTSVGWKTAAVLLAPVASRELGWHISSDQLLLIS